MRLQVQCYAGSKAEERPVHFQTGERLYLVEEILDQWYGPEHVFFKVRADDNNLYMLRHRASVPEGVWDLVSFPQNQT